MAVWLSLVGCSFLLRIWFKGLLILGQLLSNASVRYVGSYERMKKILEFRERCQINTREEKKFLVFLFISLCNLTYQVLLRQIKVDLSHLWGPFSCNLLSFSIHREVFV